MALDSVFRIVRHDPRQLMRERERLLGAVREATTIGSLCEVGSTAVEGVVGKEDIDFALIVPRNQFGLARRDLDRVFRRDPQQMSNSEYQGYRLPSTYDAALQLVVFGSKFDTFERFLSRLRESASLRRAYNDLKVNWDGRPMDEYRTAKRAFIEAVLTEGVN
jgi:GrpB-like predicted nucleotidyltransferase (UPF0157 family)